jgi:hypothetical protein
MAKALSSRDQLQGLHRIRGASSPNICGLKLAPCELVICTSQPALFRLRAFDTAACGFSRSVCTSCPSLEAWIVNVMIASSRPPGDGDHSRRSSAKGSGGRTHDFQIFGICSCNNRREDHRTTATLFSGARWAITRELRKVRRDQGRLARRSPDYRIVIAGEIEQTLPNEGIGLVSELANVPRPFFVKFVVHTALISQ